jgi:hypothetical protein
MLREKQGKRMQFRNEKKGPAVRYYQLMTGHAVTAPYLKNTLKKRDAGNARGVSQERRRVGKTSLKSARNGKRDKRVMEKCSEGCWLVEGEMEVDSIAVQGGAS